MIDVLRLILILLSAVVVVFLVFSTIRIWSRLTFAQKIFVLGSLCMLAYSADAAREAVMLGVGWRNRLVLYVVGIVAYSIWLLEPYRSKKEHFQGKSWFSKEDE